MDYTFVETKQALKMPTNFPLFTKFFDGNKHNNTEKQGQNNPEYH